MKVKKKIAVLGLAGVLATGFGVAGCSGSNDVVDGTEVSSIENTTDSKTYSEIV